MPIETQNSALYEVKDLVIEKKDDGYAMKLSCPRATAFVLCFSKTEKPIDCQTLGLSEKDLSNLHNGATIELDNCRLQGVTAYTFAAMPWFKGFNVNPPERIQVWSMLSRGNYGNVILIVPKNEAQCYVPLEYSADKTLAKDLMLLNVKIDKRFIDDYCDGDLRYKINNLLPIPIPRSWINRTIPLSPDYATSVEVVAKDSVKYKYRQV